MLIRTNVLLDKECRADLFKALIGNKADLIQERRVEVTDGMNLAMECGMQRYFEVSSLQEYRVTTTILDIIKSVQEIQRPAKQVNNDLSLHSNFHD